MDNKLKDMTSMRIGMLSVIGRAPDALIGIKKDKHVMWNCLCDCGKLKSISGARIRSGITKSCGCLKKLLTSERKSKRTGMKEYGIWCSMINRCNDKNVKSYHRYGGRGIKVCDRWNNFDIFISDMGLRPSIHHSIDRIDNDGFYNKDNCRWVTMKEQNNNRSNNRIIIYGGKSKTLQQWADDIGINQSSLRTRLELWPIEKALTSPKKSKISYSEAQE